MTTHIELHHIGEVLLAALLRRLAQRSDMLVRCVAHADCTLDYVFRSAGIGPGVTFVPNVRLAASGSGGARLVFDGGHAVDVLAHDGSMAVAMEAKLGLDGLRPSEFERRFLDTVGLSGHRPPRVKGTMVAILNHRSLHTGEPLPLHANLVPAVPIARPWALVLRRPVWEKQWQGGSARPATLGSQGHVVLFEDVAERVGDRREFDALVAEVVGRDFHSSWRL